MPVKPPDSKKRATSEDNADEDSVLRNLDKRFKEELLSERNEDDDDDVVPEKKYDILNEDDIEGQEEGVTKMQEGVRITPFNVQEEMEEGHFDKEGNYVFEKKEEIRDAWLEGLDDYTDEDYEKLMKKKADEKEAAEFEEPSVAFASDLETMKAMLSILKPGETVARTLKRLGSSMKPIPKSRKGSTSFSSSGSSSNSREIDPVRQEFEKLTSAADLLLQRGLLEIYQETYEKLALRIKKEEDKKSMEVAAEEDIFGEAFVPKEGAKTDGSSVKGENEPAENGSDQTMWEFRWKNEDSESIHGPFTSEQMNDWVQQDYFKEGVFVRKVGSTDAQFYTSKRVDFELYI